MYRQAGMLVAALMAVATSACASESPAATSLELPARKVTIGKGISRELPRLLNERKQQPLPVVVVLDGRLDTAKRAALRAAGLQPQQSLKPDAYLALLDRKADLRRVALLVIWMAPLEPVDHVDPELWRGTVPDWARTAGGMIKILARFHETVGDAEAKVAMERWTKNARKHGPGQEWSALVEQSSLPRLAAEEGIEWIEAGPDPMLPLGAEQAGRLLTDVPPL